MNRYVKKPSIESGSFNKKGDIVNIDIDEDGYSCPNKSYLLLHCDITTNEPDSNYIYKVSLNNQNILYPNSALIRTARWESERGGTMEEIHKVNELQMAINQHALSRDEFENDSLGSMRNNTDIHNLNGSIFRDLNTVGDKPSRNLTVPIRVYLKDILGIGKKELYPNEMFGKNRLRLELDATAVPVNVETNPEVEGQDYANNTGANVNLNTITLGDPADNQNAQLYYRDNIPFHVGQLVRVTATGTGNQGDIDVRRRVTNINFNRTNGHVTITLNQELATVANTDGFNTIRILDLGTRANGNPLTADLNISEVELVLCKTEPSPDMKNKMSNSVYEYSTFTDEPFSIPALNEFHKHVQLEPTCQSVLLVRPNDNMVSESNNLERYRLKLNDDDMTNRDVDIFQPLYWDRIMASWVSMGYDLKSLDIVNGDNGANPPVPFLSTFVASPVPMTEGMKTMEINLYGGGALTSNARLYKSVRRAYKLSDGGVQRLY